MKSLIYTLKTWFHRRKMEASMREEMQQHIELQAAEYEQQGLSQKESLLKARKAFGNQTFIEEECRSSWGMRLIDEFSNDLSFAWKQICKNRVFSVVAILSLAIGSGINLSFLSAINGILLKPLSLENPEQLRQIERLGPSINGFSQGKREFQPDGSLLSDAISYPLFEDFKKAADPVAEVFCWASAGFTVDFGHLKRSDWGLLISENYFNALKIKPLLGQLELEPESEVSPERCVWISESLWQKEYDSSVDIVGNTLLIENQAFTIIGVIPSGIDHLQKGSQIDYFFLLSAQPTLAKFFQLESRKHFWLKAAARLRHVAFEGDLQRILDDTLANAEIEYNPSSKKFTPVTVISDASRGLKTNNEAYSQSLKIPFILSGVLLLVSCINLAGLQFSRNYKRIRELSIRSALGASRKRLMRQILTETFLLCLIASIHGVLIALVSQEFLTKLLVSKANTYDLSPDLRMFLVWVLIVTICTVFIGLFPALKVTNMNKDLHIGTKAETSRHNFLLGKVAIVAQIVCAIALVYTTFLFGKTLSNLYQQDPGFETSNLLLFSLQGEEGYQQAQPGSPFREEIRTSIGEIPGVESAAFAGLKLLSNNNYSTTIHKNDFPVPITEDVPLYSIDVSADFFRTLNISMIAGRPFDGQLMESDKNSVIISKSLASKAFPDSNAVGKTIMIHSKHRQIVGVAEDIQYRNLREGVKHLVYMPMQPQPNEISMFGFCIYYVRTKASPFSLSQEVRKTVSSGFPGMFIEEVETMETNIGDLVHEEKSVSVLSVCFASLTVLLTCIGLFALVNYDVTSRTQEIGIRMALGASRKKIIRWVLKRSLTPLIPGLIIGIPLALLLKHWIRDRLYQIPIFDIEGLVIALICVIASAIIAVAFPSLRAAKLDPSNFLRNE